MRSGGNSFNYFFENKLTKLAKLVEFLNVHCMIMEDWGRI